MSMIIFLSIQNIQNGVLSVVISNFHKEAHTLDEIQEILADIPKEKKVSLRCFFS